MSTSSTSPPGPSSPSNFSDDPTSTLLQHIAPHLYPKRRHQRRSSPDVSNKGPSSCLATSDVWINDAESDVLRREPSGLADTPRPASPSQSAQSRAHRPHTRHGSNSSSKKFPSGNNHSSRESSRNTPAIFATADQQMLEQQTKQLDRHTMRLEQRTTQLREQSDDLFLLLLVVAGHQGVNIREVANIANITKNSRFSDMVTKAESCLKKLGKSKGRSSDEGKKSNTECR